MKYNIDLIKEDLKSTNLTLKAICEKYNYPYKYISRVLKKEGVDLTLRLSEKFDVSIFKEMYEEYASGLTILELSEKYPYCYGTIEKYFFEVLEYPKLKNSIRLRDLNHNFFESIDTEEKAYLLGFFAADGTINKGDNGMAILLQARDVEILEYYKKAFNSHNRFYEYPAKKATHQDRLKCIIYSAQNKENLIRLGFPCRKTYNMFSLPDKIMKKDLVRHFIRGYFDGDGSIVLPTKNSRVTKFKITSSNVDFLKYIEETLINLGCTHISYDKAGGIAKSICIQNKVSIAKVFKYLYENSHYYLNRKYIKMKSVWASL